MVQVTEMPDKESKEEISVTDKDVICQRGGLANRHPGNVRYHAVKIKLRPEYMALPRLERTRISQELVDTVQRWGGRFLRQNKMPGDPRHGKWYELNNHAARTKASQGLRECCTSAERAIKRAKFNDKSDHKRRMSSVD